MTVSDLLDLLVATPGGKARREQLIELLPSPVLHPFCAAQRWGSPVWGVNVLVGDPAPSLIIGAHYDIDTGTVQGATDNTAAVAVLAAIARDAGAAGLPPGVALCFWDLEEPSNGAFAAGSAAYAADLRAAGCTPALAVVCDVFGLGPPWLSARSNAFHAYLLDAVAAERGAALSTARTPGSDDAGLLRHGIPSVLLTSLPENGSTEAWRAMHTRDDTVDLVDRLALRDTQHFLADVIATYASRTPEAIRALRTSPSATAWMEAWSPRVRRMGDPRDRDQLGLFPSATSSAALKSDDGPCTAEHDTRLTRRPRVEPPRRQRS
jgi:hypothetical protein